MPRLDAVRVATWRDIQGVVSELERVIDDQLREDWDIPLGWFDVMAALQKLGGRARPLDVAAELRLPPSSVSRRLDRLEEEGWVTRHRRSDGTDLRAVELELTRRGRKLWREMNVSFRRAVQAHFAGRLTDTDIIDARRILDKLTRP